VRAEAVEVECRLGAHDWLVCTGDAFDEEELLLPLSLLLVVVELELVVVTVAVFGAAATDVVVLPICT
jgi:hypothetical protein